MSVAAAFMEGLPTSEHIDAGIAVYSDTIGGLSVCLSLRLLVFVGLSSPRYQSISDSQA